MSASVFPKRCGTPKLSRAIRASVVLNAGAGGASAVSGSQTASDMAATTTKAKQPSKIRRSIAGPLRGRSARICARPALRWQAAVVRRGDLRGGAPPGWVQDSPTPRREGGKRETQDRQRDV